MKKVPFIAEVTNEEIISRNTLRHYAISDLPKTFFRTTMLTMPEYESDFKGRTLKDLAEALSHHRQQIQHLGELGLKAVKCHAWGLYQVNERDKFDLQLDQANSDDYNSPLIPAGKLLVAKVSRIDGHKTTSKEFEDVKQPLLKYLEKKFSCQGKSKSTKANLNGLGLVDIYRPSAYVTDNDTGQVTLVDIEPRFAYIDNRIMTRLNRDLDNY